MKTRVVHCKREPHDVYIGRPSKWGNPFSHKHGTLAQFRVRNREAAVDAYAEWIKTQPELLAALPELKGKVLGCWCKPKRCHGDVLAELADAADVWYENPVSYPQDPPTIEGTIISRQEP